MDIRSKPCRPHHVLVVEDDPDIHGLLAEVLSEAGFEVATASNGETARDVLATSAPALILLDINVPVVNGWSLLAWMTTQPHLRATRTVLISATPAQEVVAAPEGKVLASRISGVLSKPFSLEGLARTVADVGGLEPAKGSTLASA
jgi:CheY-like chemotaxis protein